MLVNTLTKMKRYLALETILVHQNAQSCAAIQHRPMGCKSRSTKLSPAQDSPYTGQVNDRSISTFPQAI